MTVRRATFNTLPPDADKVLPALLVGATDPGARSTLADLVGQTILGRLALGRAGAAHTLGVGRAVSVTGAGQGHRLAPVDGVALKSLGTRAERLVVLGAAHRVGSAVAALTRI